MDKNHLRETNYLGDSRFFVSLIPFFISILVSILLDRVLGISNVLFWLIVVIPSVCFWFFPNKPERNEKRSFDLFKSKHF